MNDEDFALMATGCFLWHALLIGLGSAALLYYGYHLKKHPAMSCSERTEGIVQAVRPQSDQFSVTIRYTVPPQPTHLLYGTILSSNNYPVGTTIPIYYSPANPSTICEVKSAWRVYIVIGWLFIIAYTLWGFTLFQFRGIRVFYGKFCIYDIIFSGIRFFFRR